MPVVSIIEPVAKILPSTLRFPFKFQVPPVMVMVREPKSVVTPPAKSLMMLPSADLRALGRSREHRPPAIRLTFEYRIALATRERLDHLDLGIYPFE